MRVLSSRTSERLCVVKADDDPEWIDVEELVEDVQVMELSPVDVQTRPIIYDVESWVAKGTEWIGDEE